MGGRRSVVQVSVPAELAELAADALWQAGPSAVGEVDLGDGRVRLTADVTDPALVDQRWDPVLVPDDDVAYLDAWRSWAAPHRAGRRFVLHPAWIERPEPDPGGPGSEGDLVVVLDPGRAFGSGSHESTRLCLAVLEDVVAPGCTVLDVGCGSGVLSIGACLLGAASVCAIDVDPEARAATVANAAANGVADRVAVDERAVGELDRAFDLVVANISAATVRALGPDLARRLAPDGTLVLAGMLDDQVDGVVAAQPGRAEVERRSEAGWSVVVLRRDQPATRRSTGPDSSST